MTAGSASAGAAPGNCTVSGVNPDAEELALIAAINSYRAQNGLGQLAFNATLERAARWMASDMVTKQGFSHVDSLGRAFWVRSEDCGYASPGGENIAAGTLRTSGQSAFDLFRSSPLHDAVMRSPEFTEIGAARAHGGYYGWYWAVEFGDGTPQATSASLASAAPVAARPAALHLAASANLVTWPFATAGLPRALAPLGPGVTVYAFDPATGAWLHFGADLPPYAQTLNALAQGSSYWIITSRPGDLTD